MNFRNISSWCIRNPVPPIVLFIALLLAGIISFSRMTVTNNPDIDFPGVTVGVSQPGAAPTEMEKQVTQKIEAAVRGVNGVDEIDSSVQEGYSNTFIQFQIGTPTDRAVNDVRNAVAQARADLPEGILEPQVERVDIAGDPIVFVAAETTDMTLEQLSWYVDNDIGKRLRGLEGVAAVNREGGVDREIRVILDPAAMQAQGITAAEVNQQLRATNLNAAGGRAEIAGSEQGVRVLGNAQTAYDLSQTQIALPGGRTVRLADIATVKDSYSEQRTLAKLGGRQVISFNVQRAKGASDQNVNYNHALRNALLPVVTVIGIEAAFLMGGLIVTETVFNIPGIVRFLVEAIRWRDYPIVQNLVMFIAAVAVSINFLIDLLYAVLDPRIRYAS